MGGAQVYGTTDIYMMNVKDYLLLDRFKALLILLTRSEKFRALHLSELEI